MIVDPLRFLLDFLAFYSIYLMLSLSLNLEYGMTGISNFGKVMFFAAGAFVAGALVVRLVAPLAGLDPSLVYDLSKYKVYNVMLATEVSRFFASSPGVALATLILTLALGALFGAILGWLAAYPAAKLKEDYLGITLVVAGELFRIFGRNYEPLICGSLGVSVPDPFAWVPAPVHDLARTAFMLAIAACAWLIVDALDKSPFGRLARAIRDNDLAAEALGKDVAKVRLTVLMIGSAIAGVAGGLYAFYTGAVSADDFTPVRTFIVWVMVVMGGAGNNAGAALGALIYLGVDRVLTIVKHSIPAPFDVNYLSYIILGVLLVAMLMYRPQGLVPEKPRPLLVSRGAELEVARGGGEEVSKGARA